MDYFTNADNITANTVAAGSTVDITADMIILIMLII
jgi:hypothetical protein